MFRIVHFISLGIAIMVAALSAGCNWATKPEDIKYHLACFNTSDYHDQIRIFVRNGPEDFGWTRWDAINGVASFYVHERPYGVQIRRAVSGEMLADFDIDINAVKGEAHFRDVTADAILVWGPDGGYQASLRDVGQTIETPNGTVVLLGKAIPLSAVTDR
jgi:hypothetical protein